jgi:hypothetical protein
MRDVTPATESAGETLDLGLALGTLRASARWIVLGVVVGALAGVAAGFVLVRYQSEGVFALGAVTARETGPNPQPYPRTFQFARGMSLQDFKTEYPRLDGDRFRAFLAARKVAVDAPLARIARLLANADTRAEILLPLYGSTRADLRELGETTKPTENLALAMRIAGAARDADEARRITTLLGDFVRESVFTSQAQSLIARRSEQYAAQRLTYENDLISTRFTIGTVNDKIHRLRELRAEFPDAATSGRQVVSIAEGGARYLSPSTQIVGMEATVADLRSQMAVTDRQRAKSELLANYFRAARPLVADDVDSAVALERLDKLLATSFTPTGQDDAAREARNEAELDVFALATLRSEGLRFVAGPVPGLRDDMRVVRYTAVAALAGGLLVMLLVLLRRAVRSRA